MASSYLIKTKGFTLIELLITIVIIGILAGIAYPSYQGVLEKTRRQEGTRTLLEAAQVMEGYYAMNLDYSGAISGGVITIFSVNEDFDEYYNLTGVATKSTYTLSATPKGIQAADDCGTLAITHSGSKTPTSDGCW